MNSEHQKLNSFLTLIIVVLMIVGIGVALVVVNTTSSVRSRLVVPTEAIQANLDKIQNTIREDIKELEKDRSDADFLWHSIEKQGLAIIGLDDSGRIVLWSTGAENLLGYKKKDALGYGIKFLLPEGFSGKHRLAFESTMRSDNQAYQKSLECQIVHKNKSTLPVELTLWIHPQEQVIAILNKKDGLTNPKIN